MNEMAIEFQLQFKQWPPMAESHRSDSDQQGSWLGAKLTQVKLKLTDVKSYEQRD